MVDQLDEKLVGLGFLNDTINGNVNHGFVLSPIPCKPDSSRTSERSGGDYYGHHYLLDQGARSLSPCGGRRRMVTALGHVRRHTVAVAEAAAKSAGSITTLAWFSSLQRLECLARETCVRLTNQVIEEKSKHKRAGRSP